MNRLPAWSYAPILVAVLLATADAGDGPEFSMPRDGTRVQGSQVVRVTGEGISRVLVTMDKIPVAEIAAEPFEWTLDASSYCGRHVLRVTAQRGPRSRWSNDATLDFPPATDVVFTVPGDGDPVAVPFPVAAAGERVTSARFYLDGTLVAEDSEPPFAWRLDPDAVFEGRHSLVVEARVAGGVRSFGSMLRTRRPDDERPGPDAILSAIRALGPGEWYEIPDTKLQKVAPPGRRYANVIAPWSGGAYDTKRDRLIVWGGGHGDYNGNEIYAFDMHGFRWERLTDPSAFPPGEETNPHDKGAHPDGAPVSRHTYDYIEYVPAADAFFVGGGAGMWMGGQVSDPETYLFDFETRKWSKHGECPCKGIGATSALGPDGRVWMHGSYGREAVLAAFDAKTSEWTRYADYGEWIGYARTAEIDPVENKYVLIGNGEVRIWDLNHPDLRHVLADTTGATEGAALMAPGAAYDPKAKAIVVWGGGPSVYGLDVRKLEWTVRRTRGVNTTPPDAADSGTYGRWRYVPSLGVFVVVNDVLGNVFVYRHS